MKIIEVSINSLGQFDLSTAAQFLNSIEGVSEVTVLDVTGQILIYCEDDKLTREQILELLSESGLHTEGAAGTRPQQAENAEQAAPVEVDETTENLLHIRIQGMHCSGCERSIENVIGRISGVSSVKAELVTGRATVAGTDLDVASILKVISRAGYQAEVVKSRTNLFESIRDQHRDSERRLFWRWVAAFLCVLLMGYSLWAAPSYEYWWVFTLVAACVVQVYSGLPYVISALRLLRYGQTSMDTLIAVGTTAAFTGALTTGHYDNFYMLMESPMILGVVGFGKWLESVSINRAVSQLALSSTGGEGVLRMFDDGNSEEVPLEEIAVGMRVVVRAGEKVQLDGLVSDGDAIVSRAWLTGEAEAVEIPVGEKVHAGAVNEGGNFTVTVTQEAGETRYDQIMDRLEKSLGQRPPIQQLADRVVSVFVPVLMLIAGGTLVGWSFLWADDFESAWRYTVAVLVIACPCALGLATPVATLISGTRALRLGALVINPFAMEQLSNIGRFVVDKTGTLTRTDLEVTEFKVVDSERDVEEMLSMARALEQHSTHPIAESICGYCDDRLGAAESLQATDVETMVGQGLAGIVNGHRIELVNDRYVAQMPDSRSHMTIGATRAWLLIDGKIAGVFSLAATCLPGVANVVATLQRHSGDRKHVVMASGDNDGACQMIAKEVGIEVVHSEVSPEGKVQIINNLKKEGAAVAIIGDGINDAMALAEADVGIAAFGGTDIAFQSADIVLLSPGLQVLGDLIVLSARTRQIIRQNLWWAFGYNVLAIPLAAGAFVGFGLTLNPMIAAGIMAGSSLLVVLNSLRLNRISLV